ncbi:MAG: FGGY family carbohydrate kinase [Fidelibacterota bacterium]
MNRDVVLVIDQGTSATKGFIFDNLLNLLHTERIDHRVNRPHPGWVESDAKTIARACKTVLKSLLETCNSLRLTPAAAGMAFQRSTFLFWTKDTAEPLTPALSWQDTRSAPVVSRLKSHAHTVQQITGIPLSPHFGGPKFAFCTGEDPHLKSRVVSGDVFFGPLSAFVTHTLTGWAVVDESIAGRSLLIGLKERRWNGSLLNLFDVPRHCLPSPVPTCHPFGEVRTSSGTLPLTCVIGDQQASLVGLKGVHEGEMALNLGTSGSVLVNSGPRPKVVPFILASVLYSFENECRFLLEGTINGVGSLFQWLETSLDIPHRRLDWENRCRTPTRGILVPGINGIAAPYWTGEFETAFIDLSPHDDPDGAVRAAMESIGFLVADICQVLHEEGEIPLTDMVASGGFSRPVLLQFIADLLDRPVWSSKGRDMTALGVARLVIHQLRGTSLNTGAGVRDRKFLPAMPAEERAERLARWQKGLRSLGIGRTLPEKKGG